MGPMKCFDEAPLCVDFVFVSSRGIWMAENLVGLLRGKGLRVIMVDKALQQGLDNENMRRRHYLKK